MANLSVEEELRAIPKRPFGVYMLLVILSLGVFAAVLEIFRTQSQLMGIWADLDRFLRQWNGLVGLPDRLFTDPTLITIANGLIIAIWLSIIVGLWRLQRWAWLILMILTGVALTFSLVRYFEGNPNYFGMLVYVAVAFYLNDRSVQRAYARHQPGASA